MGFPSFADERFVNSKSTQYKTTIVASLLAAAGVATLWLLRQLLFSASYLPHRFCYLAQPWLVWTNVAMDGLIAASYILIFASMLWVVRQTRQFPALRRYRWIFLSFASFIAACAATHIMEIVTVWWPLYPLSAGIKVICAAVSVPTAIIFIGATPTFAPNIARFAKLITTTIAERDAAEQALYSTKNSLSLALMAANGIGLWDWDIPNNLLYADATIARFYGVDPEWAAAGAPLVEYTRSIPPEDAALVKEAMSAAIATHSAYLLDYRINQGNGTVSWVNARGSCSFAADGTPLRFSGVSVEITERKLSEEKLRLTEASKREAVEALGAASSLAEEVRIAAAAALAETKGQFRLLVEGVNDHALLTVDADGLVNSWNRGAERLLGYVEEQIVGRSLARIFTPEDMAAGIPGGQIEKARQIGRAEDEGWRVREDGTRFWAVVNKTAIFEESGKLRGFAVVIQDATEKKKIALVLEAARQEKSRLQETFLSNVSHELRTPLTAIYFFVSNVTDGILGEVAPEQREQLLLALENVTQLKEMVGDLLEITRVDSLKLTVEPQRVDALRMVTEVLSTCHKNAISKDISLHKNVESGLPCVWADKHRVRQVLTNLIDNAIKFTLPGGSITLTVSLSEQEQGFLRFAVADTGCGISGEHCEFIFDRLAQVKSGLEASREGLGLGLFIAKELVTQHGGRIWVESEPGNGSTFFFTLPIFSLAGRCAHIMVPANLDRGEVTLIALDVVANSRGYEPNVLVEIEKVVERCIHPALDVVLPWMNSGSPVMTLFVVACTGREGSSVISRRIGAELKGLGNAARIHPAVATTTLALLSGLTVKAQAGEVITRIESLIQDHLRAKEKVQ